jgi:hypothetical protein
LPGSRIPSALFGGIGSRAPKARFIPACGNATGKRITISQGLKARIIYRLSILEQPSLFSYSPGFLWLRHRNMKRAFGAAENALKFLVGKNLFFDWSKSPLF